MKRLLLAVALAAVACGRPSAPQQPELFRMRIAGYYWPGMFWAEVAKEKGFFREAGIDAEIVRTDGDYVGSLDQVATGQLDTNVFNTYDILRRALAGADLQMVVISDTSMGADVVLAKPPIRDLRGLKGARVGVGAGTYQEAVLAVALEGTGVELGEVTVVPRFGDAAFEGVEAAVSWEPLASELAANGWNRLFDSSRIRGGIPFGYVFRRDYIARHPQQVQQFVNVWARATRYMAEHPDEARAIVARRYQKPVAEVAAFAKLDPIMSPEDNLRAFAYGQGTVSIHTMARRLNRLLIAQGHTNRMIDSTLLVEPRFVRRLVTREE